jgi:hypothetical protein
MLIALDYDETFTRDVSFWCQVVALGQLRGHRFVCVTARSSPPDNEREPHIPMPIVCAGNEWKNTAALRAGFPVDVWVDDMPGLIMGKQRLSFDEEPTPAQLTHLSSLLLGRAVSDKVLREVWDYVKGLA